MAIDENKIYVGGLSAETTSEGLRHYFSQFGDVTESIVMLDKMTGRSRCFGFVTFRDMIGVIAALGTSNVVDGREVSCKKALRDHPGSASASQGSNGNKNMNKLFVGGLPATCDHDKFVQYFQRFGQIEDAVVMMDQMTQRHRGFGYVTFSEGSAVEAVLQNYAAHNVDGKWIEVKRCIPQDKISGGKGGGKFGGSSGKAPALSGFGAAGTGGLPDTGSGGAAPAFQDFSSFSVPTPEPLPPPQPVEESALLSGARAVGTQQLGVEPAVLSGRPAFASASSGLVGVVAHAATGGSSYSGAVPSTAAALTAAADAYGAAARSALTAAYAAVGYKDPAAAAASAVAAHGAGRPLTLNPGSGCGAGVAVAPGTSGGGPLAVNISGCGATPGAVYPGCGAGANAVYKGIGGASGSHLVPGAALPGGLDNEALGAAARAYATAVAGARSSAFGGGSFRAVPY